MISISKSDALRSAWKQSVKVETEASESLRLQVKPVLMRPTFERLRGDSNTFAIPVATPNQIPHGPALVLMGRPFQETNARKVLIKFFEEMYSMDPGFPQRFAAIKHGHKRRYLAQRKEDLYPNRPDLLEGNSHRLQSGWWLGLHYSKCSILRIMRMACDVAGLTFDRDVRVNLG